jgi:hypothetical protein
VKFGVIHVFPEDGSDRDVLLDTIGDVTVGSAVLVLPWDDRVRLTEDAHSSTSLPRSTRRSLDDPWSASLLR